MHWHWACMCDVYCMMLQHHLVREVNNGLSHHLQPQLCLRQCCHLVQSAHLLHKPQDILFVLMLSSPNSRSSSARCWLLSCLLDATTLCGPLRTCLYRCPQVSVMQLLAVSRLMNQAVGDALSGLLLCEAVLRSGTSLEAWQGLYQDLPSRCVA